MGQPTLLLPIGPLADRGLEQAVHLFKSDHTAVALHRGTSSSGGEHQQQIQAGIIKLAIAVEQPAAHAAA